MITRRIAIGGAAAAALMFPKSALSLIGIKRVLLSGGSASSYGASQRSPSSKDDTTKGYAVGDTWVNTLTGLVYAATSVTAGSAVWALRSVGLFPLDAIATPAAAAYGVTKLRAAYAGSAFQVRRASDNTLQDIGFTATGAADWASATTFSQASQLYLAKWYDQSGNGLDATTDANANQPPLFQNRIGSRIGLDFIEAKYLVLPAGLSLDRQASTFLSCARPRSAYNATLWTMGPGVAALTGHFQNGNLEVYQGTNDLSPVVWHVDQGVRLVIFTSVDFTGGIDDHSAATAVPGGALTMSGGYIPRSTGVLAGVYGALIFYASILSAADINAVRRSIYLAHSIPPQLRDRLVIIGDSISYGFGTTTNQGYAQMMIPNLSRRYSMANCGVTSQLQSSELASTYTPFIVAGNKSVVFVFSGTNDIAANAAAGAVETTTQNLCSALKSGGFGKVIVATMLPRAAGFTAGQSSGGFETARLAYNSWVVANYNTFADVLCDWASDATMGPVAAASNPTYYGDSFNPTTLGHSLLAPYAVSAINSLG